MTARHRAALRAERIQFYRGAGSALLVIVAVALLGWSASFEGWLRWVGMGLGAMMVFVGYPVGELAGMLVAHRGLNPADVDILHALRFLETGDGGFLRQLHADDPGRVDAWVRGLAADSPEDSVVRRARAASAILGLES